MTPAAPGRHRVVTTLCVAAAVVAVDQATKHWALGALADRRTIDLVGSLQLKLAFNTGASFSIGSGLGPVLAVVVAVVVVALLRFARHVPNLLGLVSVGLVVGGAIGNLVDRVFRDGGGFLGGAVVDFIDPQWWPIFNVADMGVVVGAVLLVVGTWRIAPDDEDSGAAGADESTSSSPHTN